MKNKLIHLFIFLHLLILLRSQTSHQFKNNTEQLLQDCSLNIQLQKWDDPYVGSFLVQRKHKYICIKSPIHSSITVVSTIFEPNSCIQFPELTPRPTLISNDSQIFKILVFRLPVCALMPENQNKQHKFLVMAQHGFEIAGARVPIYIWIVYFPTAIILSIIGYFVLMNIIAKKRLFNQNSFERLQI